MITVKDLMNNEELTKGIIEDLEDFDENAEVTYEVWAMGYDEDDNVTDAEFLLREFNTPDEAVSYAREVTLADVVNLSSDDSEPLDNIASIAVEVETVIADDDEGTMNVGTIYKRDLWIDGEYGNEEDAFEDEYNEIVKVTSEDYKLLEDGSLEISCDLLKDFSKNDMVQIWFTDEDKDYKSILTYKIISMTTDNNFICEFIY